MPMLSELGEHVEIPALIEKEWRKFSAFGPNGLFEIETTNSSIDGIRLVDGDKKTVPYVTRTDTNNGIARFVNPDNLSYGSDCAGCITVGLDTQTAFWQPHEFVTGQNIQVITGSKLNYYRAQFLIPLFKSQMRAKFNWGGNGATLGRMKKLELMLPVDNVGEPDYEYMEQYVKNMLLRKYRAYLDFIEQEMNSIERERERVSEPFARLGEAEWREFRIGNLFDTSRPAARSKDDYDRGDIPFVASGSVNNGVMKFCQPHQGESVDEKSCMTVSPVDGSTFYQPVDFLGRGGAGSSVLMLRCDGLNLYRGLFMARAIRQTCSKYTYGHMGNKDSIKRERIMLPVTDAGEPDYEYMEQYSKNMMLRKYQQYLTFLQQRSDAR